MKKILLLLATASALLLTGCGDDEQEQYAGSSYSQPQYAQQPVYVQPQHDDGIGMGTVLAAGLVGSMIGGSGSSRGTSTVNHTTINKTVVNKTGTPVKKNTATPVTTPTNTKKHVTKAAPKRTYVKKRTYQKKRPTKRRSYSKKRRR